MHMHRTVLILSDEDWKDVAEKDDMPTSAVKARDAYFLSLGHREDMEFIQETLRKSSGSETAANFSELLKISTDLSDANLDSTVIAIRLVPVFSLVDENVAAKLRTWFVQMFDCWRRQTPSQQIIWSLSTYKELNRLFMPKALATPFRRGFKVLIGEYDRPKHTIAEDAGMLQDCVINRFYVKPGGTQKDDIKISDSLYWKYDAITYFMRNFGVFKAPSILSSTSAPQLVEVLIDGISGEAQGVQTLQEFVTCIGKSDEPFWEAVVPVHGVTSTKPEALKVRARFEVADLADPTYLAAKGTNPTILVVSRTRKQIVDSSWEASRPQPSQAAPEPSGNSFMKSLFSLSGNSPLGQRGRTKDTKKQKSSYVIFDDSAEVVSGLSGQMTAPYNPFVIWDCIWESALLLALPNKPAT